MAKERLQKIIAQYGIASRRKAEELIHEGLVTINGKLANLGDKADLEEDAVKVKGKLLRSKTAPHSYYAFYKPKGVISMFTEDPERRISLKDYFAKLKTKLFPIGRLHYNDEGLLLLTNDGTLADQIQKSEKIPRFYSIKVNRRPDLKDLEKLRKGMRQEGHLVQPYSVEVEQELAKNCKIRVVFLGHQHINLKDYFEKKGLLVERVVRIGIGQIRISDLQPGQSKLLKKSQLEALVHQPELGLKKVD